MLLVDATGVYIMDSSYSVKDAIDGGRDGGDWFDDPPEHGLWFWTGTIGQERGSYECPEDGDVYLTTTRWAKMTVLDAINGAEPAKASEDEA